MRQKPFFNASATESLRHFFSSSSVVLQCLTEELLKKCRRRADGTTPLGGRNAVAEAAELRPSAEEVPSQSRRNYAPRRKKCRRGGGGTTPLGGRSAVAEPTELRPSAEEVPLRRRRNYAPRRKKCRCGGDGTTPLGGRSAVAEATELRPSAEERP